MKLLQQLAARKTKLVATSQGWPAFQVSFFILFPADAMCIGEVYYCDAPNPFTDLHGAWEHPFQMQPLRPATTEAERGCTVV
jgi:hypothetical protein